MTEYDRRHLSLEEQRAILFRDLTTGTEQAQDDSYPLSAEHDAWSGDPVADRQALVARAMAGLHHSIDLELTPHFPQSPDEKPDNVFRRLINKVVH